MLGDVLVLNKNFYAVAVTDWKRAICLLYLDRALVIDEAWRTYDFTTWLQVSLESDDYQGGFVHTPTSKIAVPDVIALKMFGEVPMREVTFARKNIFQHYGYRCCYCGRHLPAEELNLDHVMPRSRGGRGDWTNVVPSCIPCNKKKGNKLPKEAGMKLTIIPTRPKAKPGAQSLLNGRTKEAWKPFLDKRPNASAG